MNSTVKTVLFWLLIGVSALLLWEVVKGARDGQKDKEVNVTEFMSDVDQNNISEITVNGMEVRGKFRDGFGFHHCPEHALHARNAQRPPEQEREDRVPRHQQWKPAVAVAGTRAPLILLGALWFFMIRQMQTGGNKALSFGKSRARLLSMQQKHKVTFKDVAGVEEAKEELREIIEFLREAQKFQKLGGRIPKACSWLALPERQDPAGPCRCRA